MTVTSPISSLKGGLSMSMLAGGVRGDLVDSGVGKDRGSPRGNRGGLAS